MEGCWAGLHVEKRVSELNQPTNLKEGGRWSGLTNEESVGLEVVSQGTVCRNWTNRDRGQQQGAPAKRQTGGREGTEGSVHRCEGEHKSLVWFRWRCRPLQHRFTAFWRQQPLAAPYHYRGLVGRSQSTCWPNGNRRQLWAITVWLQDPDGARRDERPGDVGESIDWQVIKSSRRVADSRAISIHSWLVRSEPAKALGKSYSYCLGTRSVRTMHRLVAMGR